MKILKFIGWYLLFIFYVVLSMGITIAAFAEKLTTTRNLKVIAVGFIILPFYLIKPMVNKLYPGNSGNTFTNYAAVAVLIIAFLQGIGTNTTNELNVSLVPTFAFYLCLIIALFLYNSKNPKSIEGNTSN